MALIKAEYTILLLSAPIGSGHKLAAEALEQSFAQYKNIKVVHGNIFDFFPTSIGQIFLKSYLWILRHCPCLYEVAYKWGNKENGSLWLRNILNSILAFLAHNFIVNTNPDIVIATHATPAGIMGIYKRQQQDSNILLSVVITDYTVHRWWLCDGVDIYFIADDRLREQLGNIEAEVLPTGIPVRCNFSKNYNRESLRKQFGWQKDEIICLLMGGGEGLLPMEDIVKMLGDKSPTQLRLIAITGRNNKMKKNLEAMSLSQLKVYGFIENIPELMQGCDIVITKAGGLTAAEALIAGVEYIIYKPLPGQEEGNALFLEKYCEAQVAYSTKEVRDFVLSYIERPAYLREQDRQRKKSDYGKAQAAHAVSEYLLEKIIKGKP